MASETVLVGKIRKALEAQGCIVVKMHGSRFMPEGFPDLVVIGPDGSTCFLEIKVPGRTDGPESNGLSAMQLWWLRKLSDQGARCGHADSVEAAIGIVFPCA